MHLLFCWIVFVLLQFVLKIIIWSNTIRTSEFFQLNTSNFTQKYQIVQFDRISLPLRGRDISAVKLALFILFGIKFSLFKWKFLSSYGRYYYWIFPIPDSLIGRFEGICYILLEYIGNFSIFYFILLSMAGTNLVANK